MHNIHNIQNYVEQQYICRDPYHENISEKEKITLIYRVVGGLLDEFKILNAGERATFKTEMQKIASKFSQILQLEETPQAQRIYKEFNERVSKVLPEVQFAEKDVVSTSSSALTSKHLTSEANQAYSQVRSFLAGSIKTCFSSTTGGMYAAKSFVDEVMEKFIEMSRAGEAVSLQELFSEEADKMLSPLVSRAGDIWDEEDMLDVLKEFQLNGQESDYAYQEYDQDSLKACVDLFMDDLADEPWQDIEVTHFRIGSTLQDYETLLVNLSTALSSSEWEKYLGKWEFQRTAAEKFEQALGFQEKIKTYLETQITAFLKDGQTSILNVPEFASNVVESLFDQKKNHSTEEIEKQLVKEKLSECALKMMGSSVPYTQRIQFKEMLIALADSSEFNKHLVDWNASLNEVVKAYQPKKL